LLLCLSRPYLFFLMVRYSVLLVLLSRFFFVL